MGSRFKGLDIHSIKQNLNFSSTKTTIAFLLSLVAWVADYVLLFECFLLIDLEVDLLMVLENGPLLTLGRLFPFTLNGLGSDEALMIYLFTSRGLNFQPGSIFAVAILYRLVMLIIPALPGLYYIYFLKPLRK